MNDKKKQKLVFRETRQSKPKVVYGYIVDENDIFFIVETTDHKTFQINKTCVMFIKEMGDF